MKKEFEDEMKEELQEKYHESLDFWNSALKSDEAEFADANPDSDWRELGRCIDVLQ